MSVPVFVAEEHHAIELIVQPRLEGDWMGLSALGETAFEL